MATPERVRLVTGSTADDTALEPFITASDCVIQRLEARVLAKGITQACIDEASNWLAAHFLSVSNVGKSTAGKKMERFESYSVSWAISNIEGQGALATNYGQTANTMLGGCLAEADKRQFQVGFFGCV